MKSKALPFVHVYTKNTTRYLWLPEYNCNENEFRNNRDCTRRFI